MKDEQLDIVDKHDKVITQRSRNQIYNKGLPAHQSIRVINIFVFNKQGKLLLPKRSANRKLFPNCYDFSCGEHVMAEETYDQAAQRGLHEELGINEKLTYIGKLGKREGVSSFMQIYTLTYEGPFNYDQQGIAELCWFNKQQLKELLNHPEQCKPDLLKVLHWYF